MSEHDDLRRWACEWVGRVSSLREWNARKGEWSDADLAEAVRVKLLAEHTAEIVGYRSVDLAITWFDDGPLAFMRAVQQAVEA